MPVIDRMITAKHDLSPRTERRVVLSALKAKETVQIFPDFGGHVLVLSLRQPNDFFFADIHMQFGIQGRNAKDVYSQFLAVLKSTNSRSLQSLKCGSRRSDSIAWLILSFSRTVSLPYLFNLSPPSSSLPPSSPHFNFCN